MLSLKKLSLFRLTQPSLMPSGVDPLDLGHGFSGIVVHGPLKGSLKKSALACRIAAFRDPSLCGPVIEDHFTDTSHVVIFDPSKKRVAATCLLFRPISGLPQVQGDKILRPDYLAVLPEYQRTAARLGSQLLCIAEKVALHEGKFFLHLYALPNRVDYYLRQGFEVVSQSADMTKVSMMKSLRPLMSFALLVVGAFSSFCAWKRRVFSGLSV